MADNDAPLFNTNVSVILIAMGSAAFVVTMYHLIAVCLCSHHFTDQNSDQPPPPPPHQNILVAGATAQMPSINETSVAYLIPAHKYKKKVDDDVAGDHKDNSGDDVTCAVCLGDFEEGEELRTLPECAHSFHVPCIDVWLYSHPSCPVCRTNATPSPAVNHCVPEYVPGESNAHDHRIDIGQIALVQNGSMQR